MKEDTLQSLKEFNSEYIANMTDNNKVIQRINELQKDAKVKEYFRLTHLDVKPYEYNSDTTRKNEIMNLYHNTKEYINNDDTSSNRIYLYCGIDNGSMFGIDYFQENIEDFSPLLSYLCKKAYWDLEKKNITYVPILECEKFEKNNRIIYLSHFPITEKDYYKIQKEYIIKAIESTQEEAVSYVLKKYNKKS